MPLYLSLIICLVTHVHTLRCNNGGRGGIFSKVKQLFVKCIELKKRLCNSSSQWDVWNADTFHPGIFHPYNNVCIYAHDHKLLKYARIFGFEPILGRWQSILWPFCVFETQFKLAILFIAYLNCIFPSPRRIFWADKTSGTFHSRKVTRVVRNPPVLWIHQSIYNSDPASCEYVQCICGHRLLIKAIFFLRAYQCHFQTKKLVVAIFRPRMEKLHCGRSKMSMLCLSKTKWGQW